MMESEIVTEDYIKQEPESAIVDTVFEFVDPTEDFGNQSTAIKLEKNPLLIEVDATRIGELKSLIDYDATPDIVIKSEFDEDGAAIAQDSIDSFTAPYPSSEVDTTERSLEDHSAISKDVMSTEKPFACPFCQLRSKLKNNMTKHVKTIHPNQFKEYILKLKPRSEEDYPFACPFCQLRSKLKHNMNKHVRSMHPDQFDEYISLPKIPKQKSQSEQDYRFECPYCEHRSDLKRNLKNHVKAIHPDRLKEFIRLFTTPRPTSRSEDCPFACPFCQYRCKYKSNLKVHVENNHPDRLDEYQVSCSTTRRSRCGSDFLSETIDLNPKYVSNIEVKRYACPNCPMTITSKFNLKSHLKSCKGENARKRQFTCPFCAKTFIHKQSIGNHIETIHPNFLNDYKLQKRLNLSKILLNCDKCPMKFPSETEFESHQLQHSIDEEKRLQLKNAADQKWLCSICSKQLNSEQMLKVHEKSHLEDYTCKECGKRLATKSTLEQHMLIHANSRLACRFCPKTFITKSGKEQHERIHTGEKPFHCPHPGCSKSFAIKQIMKQHSLTHTDIKPHSCDICHKQFRLKAQLKYHTRVHTGEKLECHLCPRQFARGGDLNRHLRQDHKVKSE